MRFAARHLLHGPPAAVARLLVDPAFYSALELPDLGLPEVLASEASGDGGMLRLRYEFTGSLDPLARRLLGGEALAWVQELRVGPDASGGWLDFRAERAPGRLHGEASFELRGEAQGTLRLLEGELVVAVPGIGRMAERRIVPGLLGRLELEAAALDQRLAVD